MRIKWVLSISFLLGLIACQGAEIRNAEIICRPSSAFTTSVDQSGMITIAWDSNKEPLLAGYRIFYGTASGRYKNCVDVGKPSESAPGVTGYTLTGLIKGERYFIAVIAYDKNNKRSGFSSEVGAVAK